MKTKLLVLLLLIGSIIPNLLFSQYSQQGPKLVGTGSFAAEKPDTAKINHHD